MLFCPNQSVANEISNQVTSLSADRETAEQLKLSTIIKQICRFKSWSFSKLTLNILSCHECIVMYCNES